jgi:hypothetical protein
MVSKGNEKDAGCVLHLHLPMQVDMGTSGFTCILAEFLPTTIPPTAALPSYQPVSPRGCVVPLGRFQFLTSSCINVQLCGHVSGCR